MSLKSNPRLLGSVKSKLVAAYTLIFAALAATGFLLAYLAIRTHLMSELDRFLSLKSSTFEGRLAAGEDPEHGEHKVALVDIPTAVREAALAKAPGLRITQCKMERKRGGREYEVGGIADGCFYEMEIHEDGTVKEVDKGSAASLYGNLAAVLEEDAAREGTDKVFYLVLSAEQKNIASSRPSGWEKTQSAIVSTLPGGEQCQTLQIADQDHAVRVFSRPMFDGSTIHIAASMVSRDQLLSLCRMIFLVALGVMCLVGTLCGWAIANRAMAGVQRVTNTARDIAAGNLSARVPVGREGTEIEELAQAFNDMLTRLEALVFELKEISNNIAHDLRTPLTRIRSAAETTVSGEETISNYRVMAGDVTEECDRLVEMINTMLEIARADSGAAELTFEDVDLNKMVKQACELMLPMAEMKGIQLEQDISKGALQLQADRMRLQRVVANLLDNAIKYTPEKGSISVATSCDNGHVKFVTKDTGVGIPAEEQEHVFDRFYRCDSSRSQPGNGLGLSLVQALVVAHGGRIELNSSADGGTTITVVLPVSQKPTNITER